MMRNSVTDVILRVASLGYALPGTVLAIGLLGPLALMDDAIASVSELLTGRTTGLVMSASGVALIYAYVARFLTISTGNVESGLSRLSPRSLVATLNFMAAGFAIVFLLRHAL
jgi:iron(III) transport system permease protein